MANGDKIQAKDAKDQKTIVYVLNRLLRDVKVKRTYAS